MDTKPYSFTTVELLISISIIITLTGMFLLNYRLQGKVRDLTDACHIISQRVRKAQNMAMGQSKLPAGPPPQSYGVYFEKDEDYFDVFADTKEVPEDYLPDVGIERIFLPVTIKISDIKVDGGNVDPGWVNFLLRDLSVKMNGGDHQEFEIKVCIKSDCIANTKKIKINNKGMIEIE